MVRSTAPTAAAPVAPFTRAAASVTLTATAASGWTFSGWSGACSGGNPCNLIMNSRSECDGYVHVADLHARRERSGARNRDQRRRPDQLHQWQRHLQRRLRERQFGHADRRRGERLVVFGMERSLQRGQSLQPGHEQRSESDSYVRLTLLGPCEQDVKGGNPLTSLTIPATGTGHLIAVAMLFNGTDIGFQYF